MENFLYILLNNCMAFLCGKDARRVYKAQKKILKSQKKILKNILDENDRCQYGKKYNFSKIKTTAGFLSRVPITEYSDYLTYINLIANDKKMILTDKSVSFIKSSSLIHLPKKYIPYNKLNIRQSRISLNAWLHFVLTKHKGVKKGTLYWFQPPYALLKDPEINSQVPIKIDDDMSYFSVNVRRILHYLQTVPEEVRKIKDPDAFRYVTLLFLLRDKNLTQISIWHPSYLLLLLEQLHTEANALIDDITRGGIKSTLNIDSNVRTLLLNYLTPDPERAGELRNILTPEETTRRIIPEATQQIWPILKVVSCYNDGLTDIFTERLKDFFPHAEILIKGWHEPEGILTNLLKKGKQFTPAVASYFFEFIELDNQVKHFSTDSLTTLLAHEVKKNDYYTILMTTGGLYRYKLPFIVRISGFHGRCPIIKFVGRTDVMFSLHGEDFKEYELSRKFDALFKRNSVLPRFHMLAPEKTSKDCDYYVLYLQFDEKIDVSSEKLIMLMETAEKCLLDNHFYRKARGAKQIEALGLFLIDPQSRPEDDYIHRFQSIDYKLGNIRWTVCNTLYDWKTVFKGRLLTRKAQAITVKKKILKK